MKTKEEIERVLRNLPYEGTKYRLMTYEQGIEEALLWIQDLIPDDDLDEYFKIKQYREE